MAVDEVTPSPSEPQTPEPPAPEPAAVAVADTPVDPGLESGAPDTELDADPVITALQETITRLAGEGDSLRQQLEERNTQYMRLAADFDNFRKRTQREKDDLAEQIKCVTITDLLPVVDNFERARAHINPQTEAEEKIHRSYQGVYKQLVECLKKIGVSAMRPEGQPFDPNLHEAVMREVSDDHPEGTVLEELVRGYLLGDRVLRHAMVKVSIPGDGEPSPAATESPADATPDPGLD